MTPLRSTLKASRILVPVLAIVALAMPRFATADDPADRRGETRVYTLDPSTLGNNPEGIAYDESTGAFFVGGVGDGTIYRGTLNNPKVTEFIPGQAGNSANGMRVARGKLYVAGGFTGRLLVFDIATKQTVASFGGFGAGMLNDLVVTQTGDVYITDSFVPTLWHITAAQVAAGGGVPDGIPVEPEIQYAFCAFCFNLNGIVALKGGRSLIVDHSHNGKLYRIDLDGNAPHGREITQIAAEPLMGCDGLLLDGSDLIVVQGGIPATLNFVRLDGKVDRGEVIQRRTDPAMRDSSGVTRAPAISETRPCCA